MKKYLSLIMLMVAGGAAMAQNRLDIAGFSQFKQYFNPALTGQEGTALQSFYRNQMTTFDNAPRTLFLSGEANLSDIRGKTSERLQHGFGLTVLHDAFGAFRDNRVNLSYSAAIKISAKLSLRTGVAATYNNVKIDAQELLLAEQNDAAYSALLNSSAINKYGVNIGVALSSDDFYVGYALNDAVNSGKGDQEYLGDSYLAQHAMQAGYRRALNDDFGLVVNGLYRYDQRQRGIAEGQLKAVFLNTFWIGAGYRQDIAYTFNGGFRLKQFKIAYSRELNVNKIGGAYGGGNELVLGYSFTPLFGKSKRTLNIW